MKPKLLIGLSLVPVLVGTQSCETKQEKPNILFILSDDHTSQAWGIYGGILADYIKNDNIRRLADEGCVLNNSFCTNSISVPSRASIMTGAYGHVTGVRTLSDGLDPEMDNIAKRMQQGGYQTALIGKWHLKKEPSGFDYYSVFHDQGDYVDPTFKTAENWVDDDKGRSGIKETGFSTDLTTAKTIDWLSSRNKDEPFMMFCHFKATHEPFDFPERMRDLYDGVLFPEPETLFDFDYKKSGRTFAGQQLENLGQRWASASDAPDKWWCKYPELPFYTKGLSPEQDRADIYQKFVRDFLRCGATIDDNIGKLLEYLDDEGIAENTIVVYVSDQGYFMGEHGMFDKRMMYEESLRMPFVIRYPKEIPAGTRNDDIVLNIDFASLLADYAGVSEPELAQGHSFRENLKGDTPEDWRESMYYRYWTHHDIRPAHMGVRNDRYKLMYLYGDPLDTRGSSKDKREPSWEFFDLKEDAQETKNLYGDKQYDSQIAQMKKELALLCEQAGDKMWQN